VVCADGALVREGPSLSSAQVQELPQHSIIEVHSVPQNHLLSHSSILCLCIATVWDLVALQLCYVAVVCAITLLTKAVAAMLCVQQVLKRQINEQGIARLKTGKSTYLLRTDSLTQVAVLLRQQMCKRYRYCS
jgi:hypothetical protein